MATDQTPAGAARIVKTKRVQHVVTTDENTAQLVILDAVWDAPFADLNYTVGHGVEVISPAVPGNYSVLGFTKAVDKVTVTLGAGGSVADALVLHVHGIRD